MIQACGTVPWQPLREIPSPGGHLTLSVRDRFSLGVAGATVTLESPSLPGPLVLHTWENGDLRVDGLPVGEYTVAVEAVGLAPAPERTKVAGPSPAVVELTLDAGAPVDLTGVGGREQVMAWYAGCGRVDPRAPPRLSRCGELKKVTCSSEYVGGMVGRLGQRKVELG